VKNLVVCCDGTWKKSDDKYVSNIEKIARAIDPTPDGDPAQIVYYTAGVGTGATRFERLAGGAFGLGLDAAIIGAYRFLALNYEHEDQVYVFGFSRGAYTARSLVGMIDAVGLLTPDGVVKNSLSTAIWLYRHRPAAGEKPSQEWASTMATFTPGCHHQKNVIVRFLGVFDTVGTLGVPGVSRRRYRFHNVALTSQVVTARHALAIHERRRAFAPAVWTANKDATPDVKQVWFDGVHSDVGGGYDQSALADKALAWMSEEAKRAGLVFVDHRLVLQKEPLTLHNSLTAVYRVLNLLSAAAGSMRPSTRFASRFRKGWRILQRPAGTYCDADVAVGLAPDVYDRLTRAQVDDLPLVNVRWWMDEMDRDRVTLVAGEK
jgi:uncharacterized protein (DUF2235 family)